jgi:CRP-like cAMP-binding protein
VSAEADAEDEEFDPPVIPKEAAQLEQLSTVVKKCPLFFSLQAEDRAVVIGALEPVTFAAGTTIIQQGTIPDISYWYIIAKGSVHIQKEGVGVVATLSEGQSFGELELMYSTPAQTSTVVTSDLAAFRLDRRSYRKIVMRVCTERRKLYRELLSGVPFAHCLTEHQHLQLADALSPIRFLPGDVLIKPGDQNEWMYIIVDGVVEVFSHDGKQKVCDLRRGEMVGELEFLNKHPAVASCVAKTHVQACKLHREHFEMCLGPVTDFIHEVLKQPKYNYYNEQLQNMRSGK